MIASLMIIAFSLPLLVYWFHSVCTLIVRSRAGECQLGATIQLSFPKVRENLSTDSAGLLHESYAVLLRDHVILTDLLAGLAGPSSTENRLLALDFQILRFWYPLIRRTSLSLTRNALSDMAGILNSLAIEIGHQAVKHSDERQFA